MGSWQLAVGRKKKKWGKESSVGSWQLAEKTSGQGAERSRQWAVGSGQTAGGNGARALRLMGAGAD